MRYRKLISIHRLRRKINFGPLPFFSLVNYIHMLTLPGTASRDSWLNSCRGLVTKCIQFMALISCLATRLFSVEWKLLTQKSDSFWFLNQRSEWMPWALKNHSKIWFGLNPFDSFWFNQPNDLPDDSSDMWHSQVLVWESKGISYSTDASFIHGESNYWVNDSELKTA